MEATQTIYETHPAAEIFPLMSGPEIKEMADDIRQNGLREPITCCEGKILDGRNRLKACSLAEVEPAFRELPAGVSPAQYVWSANYTRRHLTVGQRAMAATTFADLLAKEAKARMSRGGTLAVRQGVEIIPHPDKGRTRDKLAEMAGVNGRYIADAQTIHRESPELAAEVMAGTVKIPEAKRRLKAGGAAPSDVRPDDENTFDTVLLVVDVVIGSTDRDKRKEILREIFFGAVRSHDWPTPCIILLKELYREGSVQSYLPRRGIAIVPDGWTSLEDSTRVAGCEVQPVRVRRLTARLNNSKLEERAAEARKAIECALREHRENGAATGRAAQVTQRVEAPQPQETSCAAQ